MASGRQAVASRGFSGLAVREIAREAGIVPTAFYRHFESLDALASELATGAADTLAALVDDMVSAPTDQPAAEWPRRAATAAGETPQTWSVLARGLVDTAHPDHRVLTGAVVGDDAASSSTVERLGPPAAVGIAGLVVIAGAVLAIRSRRR